MGTLKNLNLKDQTYYLKKNKMQLKYFTIAALVSLANALPDKSKKPQFAINFRAEYDHDDNVCQDYMDNNFQMGDTMAAFDVECETERVNLNMCGGSRYGKGCNGPPSTVDCVCKFY